MRNIVIIAVIVLSLPVVSGCQKHPEPYGNFAKVESADLVQDALTVLLSAYPPAKTRLNLLQPVEDLFGFRLVESLRGNGYAVTEYTLPDKSGKAPALTDSSAGLGFGYVLDHLIDGGELRVTLHVGDETVSRMYQVQGAEGDAQYVPIGSWVRRQEGEPHAGQ